MKARSKTRLFSAVAVLFGVAGALAATEAILRLSGHGPWRYVSVDSRIPVMNDPDPTLSWRPKPGEYVIGPYAPQGKPFRVTVHADGSRATPAAPEAAGALVFVGGSFTFGWAVSDDETFAWNLGEKLPRYQVINRGVGGYGTYQSLLILEELLADGPPPTKVLYGYMEGHEYRNVAHPLWTFALTKYSRQGMVAVPFCTLDAAGRLRRRQPERYPQWPLKEHLAAVNFLEHTYVKRQVPERSEQAQRVTDLLLLEMAELCRKHGVDFAMVFLYATESARNHYSRLLHADGVETIDCHRPLTPDMRVPGDGHPNSSLHAEWADCLAAALDNTGAGGGRDRAAGGR